MRDDLSGRRVGDYILDVCIGTGGMATVYRATRIGSDELAAVKILRTSDPTARARFRREAELQRSLRHLHILPVLASGEAEDLLYLVMPLAAGSLGDRVHGGVAVADAVEWCCQVAAALHCAHVHGVVHRDVKPTNVLLDPENRTLLADFGVARLDDDRSPLTGVGLRLGTAEYVSPEQARGQPADARSDQYALAIMLFELVTGAVPFCGDDNAATLRQHLFAPVPSLRTRRSDVPKTVDAVVARALAKDPSERFPTVAVFADELHRALDPRSVAPATGALDIGSDAASTAVGTRAPSGGEPALAAAPSPDRAQGAEVLPTIASRRRGPRSAPWRRFVRAPLAVSFGIAALAVMLLGLSLVSSAVAPALPAPVGSSVGPEPGTESIEEGEPAAVPLVSVVCDTMGDTFAAASAALGSGALDDAKAMLSDLTHCPGGDLALVDRRINGIDVLISARAALLAGSGPQAVVLLAAQRAIDPDLPGLDDALFVAMLETGRGALAEGLGGEARAYCGEALAMRPTEERATQCVLAAAPPTPTPEPTPRPSPSPVPSATPTPQPAATASPPPTTFTPTPAPVSPTAEPAGLAPSCASPLASFATPAVALGATTALVVSGLTPDEPFTLLVTSAPEGYSSPARQLRTDAACQRSIPLVFRPEEHPPGLWTFTVHGTRPGGGEVTLSAGIRVTP
jgi:hypothetical protein